MTKDPEEIKEDIDSSTELSPDELQRISGGIGGTNGIARTGSGNATPPPTAPPRI